MFCHLHLGIMFGFWMEENNCIDIEAREKCYHIFMNRTTS